MFIWLDMVQNTKTFRAGKVKLCDHLGVFANEAVKFDFCFFPVLNLEKLKIWVFVSRNVEFSLFESILHAWILWIFCVLVVCNFWNYVWIVLHDLLNWNMIASYPDTVCTIYLLWYLYTYVCIAYIYHIWQLRTSHTPKPLPKSQSK